MRFLATVVQQAQPTYLIHVPTPAAKLAPSGCAMLATLGFATDSFAAASASFLLLFRRHALCCKMKANTEREEGALQHKPNAVRMARSVCLCLPPSPCLTHIEKQCGLESAEDTQKGLLRGLLNSRRAHRSEASSCSRGRPLLQDRFFFFELCVDLPCHRLEEGVL